MSDDLKKLLIVMPCYNEEAVLPQTIKVIGALLKKLIKGKKVHADSKVCFVNDGSSDKTWALIKKAAAGERIFSGISLSRNFGHQKAIIAGMYDTDADLYVTIDADLQDDCGVIETMLDKINDGCEIVYGVRDSRDTDTRFKKYSALAFYKLMKLLGVNIVYNHADFRMMTRRAVNTLKQFPERNLFLRAMMPLVGFKSDKVYYDRKARHFKFFDCAAQTGNVYGFFHLLPEPLFSLFRHLPLVGAGHNCRLGFAGNDHYDFFRRAAGVSGDYRGISGQDFRRSQAAAAVYCR